MSVAASPLRKGNRKKEHDMVARLTSTRPPRGRAGGTPPARRTKRYGCGAAAMVALTFTLGGCGATQAGGSGPDPQAVHVRYESMHEGGDSGGVLLSQDVLAQGDRFRMTMADAATPGEVYQTVVWDGESVLLLEGEDASREESPPPDQRPASFFLRPGEETFERRCPGGTKGGSARVADRPGTVYSCPAHGTGDAATEAFELVLDDETGLLLRSVGATFRMEAVEVDLDADVDSATFSTEIPAALRGPEDSVDDEGDPLPLTATDSIPQAGGGELLLADVRHGPALVVIGELPGVTEMLARVLPQTSGGTAPRVYVLLNPIPFEGEGDAEVPDFPLTTEEGTKKLIDAVSAQVADVPVPVGIDIKGGAAGEDLRSFEDLMAGTTVLAAIDESGALAWRMTDDELMTSAGQLDDWIASTT